MIYRVFRYFGVDYQRVSKLVIYSEIVLRCKLLVIRGVVLGNVLGVV